MFIRKNAEFELANSMDKNLVSKAVDEKTEALKKLTGSTVKLSGVYPGFFGNYAFMLNLNE